MAAILLLTGVVALVVRRADSGSGWCPDGTTIRIGQQVDGNVSPDRPERFCLEFVGPDGYFEARVRSSGDTTLRLIFEGQEIAYDDDSYDLDPAIYGLWEAGEYVLEVALYFEETRPAAFSLIID